jgi:quinol monooxygenase YgiN
MAAMLIQHRVKDFATWKKVFDSVHDLRVSGGELTSKIFRDAQDPNSLTVLNTWDTLANAEKFAHSPELRAAMEKAGVEGMPSIHFLNEA